MLFESQAEVQKMKQIIGVIQSCKLPEMKGIDAFALHNSCEFFFNHCVKFEEDQLNKQNKEQKKDITAIAQEVQEFGHGMQKKEKSNKKIDKKNIKRKGR